MQSDLPPGLYEAVLTLGLQERLRLAKDLEAALGDIDPEEAHVVLSRHLHGVLETAFRGYSATERLKKQVDLSNRILELLATEFPDAYSKQDRVTDQRLESIRQRRRDSIVQAPATERPGIPLSNSELLINATGEYRIGHEIEKEIRSADRIDLLLSFIKWSGLRILKDALEAFLEEGKPLRVISTVYMGATDQKALDFLVGQGADVRVSYDTRRTRLHAKAWLFHRNTGYSTAYIGSSNLSAAAQIDGLEWNVRVSAIDAPRIVRKFRAAFDTYWEDGEFVPYDGSDDCRQEFTAAIARERSADYEGHFRLFDIRPYAFQEEILEQLEVERDVHGRTKNLVVAATGTGKTIIAALDFRRLREKSDTLRLLFVAHRKEILKQSRSVFRHVMRDGTFGELFVDGERPTQGDHVFASVQSLARIDTKDIDPHAWDMVIIDEFHHAAADTYDRLLSHLKPRFLLGLTATPERSDGQDILHWFDGRVAAELRLWDAIDRGLLAPFQYFGIHDNMDLTHIRWVRGRYDGSELEKLFTGNDLRVNMILEALREKVSSLKGMRAIGFCAGVAHADFMADRFGRAGIAAASLTGQTARPDRDAAIARLARGELQILFTVDLFNEGVDIPEVDTVLFLRPTESATVFLQQLGRGLRLHEGKECLTVLDFIGNAHRSFRFDIRYRALTGGSRRDLERHIEAGFPLLPSGCSMQLDRASRDIVLSNVRQSIGARRNLMVDELVRLGGDTSLRAFLHETGLELADVYRGSRFWSDLRRSAGLDVPAAGPDEDQLGRGLGRILHIDDPERIRWMKGLVSGLMSGGGDDADATIQSQPEGFRRRLMMMLCTLFDGSAAGDLEGNLSRLAGHPAILSELMEVFPLLIEKVGHIPRSAGLPEDIPLMLHCSYSRDEIMAAFGDVRGGKLYQPREGVVYHEQTRTNLHFVTLNKSEKEYSPSTMYEDYALSATEFHIQSQSQTSPDSVKGKRHWNHTEQDIQPLLFMRERKKDDSGGTMPYIFLGPMEYVRHTGARPMNVTWQLRTPIPADHLRAARVAG